MSRLGDAKNLRRTLLLTAQLAQLKLPLVLDLNMEDESKQLGIQIDSEKLSRRLGVPVVETVATQGTGIERLRRNLHTDPSVLSMEYNPLIGLKAF